MSRLVSPPAARCSGWCPCAAAHAALIPPAAARPPHPHFRPPHFSCAGIQITDAAEFLPALEKALEAQGPVLMAVNVDYSQNAELFANSIQERFH